MTYICQMHKDKRPNIETLSEALNYLDSEGFVQQFESIDTGIRDVKSKRVYHPKEMECVDQFRFEGMSNPSDNSLLLALVGPDGMKGTLVMSYGAEHFQNIRNIKKIEL